jgi:hypothetical protein
LYFYCICNGRHESLDRCRRSPSACFDLSRGQTKGAGQKRETESNSGQVSVGNGESGNLSDLSDLSAVCDMRLSGQIGQKDRNDSQVFAMKMENVDLSDLSNLSICPLRAKSRCGENIKTWARQDFSNQAPCIGPVFLNRAVNKSGMTGAPHEDKVFVACGFLAEYCGDSLAETARMRCRNE